MAEIKQCGTDNTACDGPPIYKNKKSELYCKYHKQKGMYAYIWCLKCSKKASFGLEHNKGLLCKIHNIGYKNVISKLCKASGCDKIPSFGLIGTKIKEYCKSHIPKDKLKEYVNVTSRARCKFTGCIKQPTFGKLGSKSREYCAAHIPINTNEEYKDINTKKCIFDGCEIGASHGLIGTKKRLYCAQHNPDKDKYIDVNSKRCKIKECKKLAHYGPIGSKLREYCCQHIPSDKYNDYGEVSTKKCLTLLCGTQAPNPKYKGYCSRCFIFKFPDEPNSRNYKTKEKAVVDAMKEDFCEFKGGVEFICDKRVDGGCSKRRPDVLIDRLIYSITLEVDESQHWDYNCESKRIMELFQDLGSRPMYVIRFNPDDYIKDGVKHHSPWKDGIVKPTYSKEWNDRLIKLGDVLENCLRNPPTKELEVIHLYYNDEDEN